MEALRRILGDLRGAAALALVVLGLLGGQGRALLAARERTRHAERTTANIRQEITSLEQRLADERAERERLGVVQAGLGPGGVPTPWDDLMFDGPTAARSALDLALAADETGYRKLRYEDQGVREIARFPSASGGNGMMEEVAASPVRDRYAFMEWPVLLTVESDYGSLVQLLERLVHARPAFALKEWEIRVIRREDGEPTDRLAFEAVVSTYWLDREMGS